MRGQDHEPQPQCKACLKYTQRRVVGASGLPNETRDPFRPTLWAGINSRNRKYKVLVLHVESRGLEKAGTLSLRNYQRLSLEQKAFHTTAVPFEGAVWYPRTGVPLTPGKGADGGSSSRTNGLGRSMPLLVPGLSTCKASSYV